MEFYPDDIPRNSIHHFNWIQQDVSDLFVQTKAALSKKYCITQVNVLQGCVSLKTPDILSWNNLSYYLYLAQM